MQKINNLTIFLDRSLMAKKADGVKESTDSSTTIEDDDVRGEGLFFVYTYLLTPWHHNIYLYM